MVRKISDIKWFIENERIDLDQSIKLNKIPNQLPKIFLETLSKYNGDYINYEFNYFDMDFEKILCSGIRVIYGLTSDIIQ